MTKSIALRAGINDTLFHAGLSKYPSHLKQQALLFNQIGIFRLKGIYKAISSLKKYPGLTQKEITSRILELEWLEENEIIFEPTAQEELHPKAIKSFMKANPSSSVDVVRKLIKKAIELNDTDLEIIEKVDDIINIVNEYEAIILRLMSLVMETSKKVSAVTALPHTEYLLQLPSFRKGDVAQIVINNLPLPNNETPWEKIIDFRNDPVNQNNLLTLRRWIRKVSTEPLSRAEIEEEIEWLINEFQQHMQYHKIKANTETLEVLVKAPLEIIEDLLKLKLSKIPEPFFAVKKRQLALMEAEMNAPGKELAYIIKSREAFQSQE